MATKNRQNLEKRHSGSTVARRDGIQQRATTRTLGWRWHRWGWPLYLRRGRDNARCRRRTHGHANGKPSYSYTSRGARTPRRNSAASSRQPAAGRRGLHGECAHGYDREMSSTHGNSTIKYTDRRRGEEKRRRQGRGLDGGWISRRGFPGFLGRGHLVVDQVCVSSQQPPRRHVPRLRRANGTSLILQGATIAGTAALPRQSSHR